MSHFATSWAIKQRGLEPVTKLLLWCLADRHNGKSGQCNPSQQGLARDCEISRATVNRHLKKLESAGLIRRVQNFNQRTHEKEKTSYFLALETKFPVSENEQKLCLTSAENHVSNRAKAMSQIRQKPCLKSGKSHVSNCDINLGREPGKELCVDAANPHTSELFEEFWKVYPKPRSRDVTAKLFSKFVESGIDQRWILQAAGKYAAENAGNNPMYVANSDNWLKNRRWEDFPQATKAGLNSRNLIEEQALFWAKIIKTATYISPSAISDQVLHFIIQNGLASSDDFNRFGLKQ